MEKLYDAIRRFRSEMPPSGSVYMVTLLDDIIEEYNVLSKIELEAEESRRFSQLQILSAIPYIKKYLIDGAFGKLGGHAILYGEIQNLRGVDLTL